VDFVLEVVLEFFGEVVLQGAFEALGWVLRRG
jgi:hypothetical protein